GGCLHHAGDATDLKGVDEAVIVMVISGIFAAWEERATMGTRLTAIRGRGQPNPEELYPTHRNTHTHTYCYLHHCTHLHTHTHTHTLTSPTPYNTLSSVRHHHGR